jgi:hypothetical protein
MSADWSRSDLNQIVAFAAAARTHIGSSSAFTGQRPLHFRQSESAISKSLELAGAQRKTWIQESRLRSSRFVFEAWCAPSTQSWLPSATARSEPGRRYACSSTQPSTRRTSSSSSGASAVSSPRPDWRIVRPPIAATTPPPGPSSERDTGSGRALLLLSQDLDLSGVVW